MIKTIQKIFPAISILPALIFVAGCSGSIKKTDNINNIENTTLSSIEIIVTEDAQKELTADSVFSAEILKQTIETQLQKASLTDPNSQYQLTISVNDVRYRSSTSAVLLGFMAGNDHIYGTAFIKDKQGNIANEFDVNTSYAFGGIAGGVAALKDSSRMGWLYERFAELVLEGIVGEYGSNQ